MLPVNLMDPWSGRFNRSHEFPCRARGVVLREPEAVDWDPSICASAVPSAGEADRLRPGLAPELQNPRLRRAVQPRPACGRRLLQLPAGGRLRRKEEIITDDRPVTYLWHPHHQHFSFSHQLNKKKG